MAVRHAGNAAAQSRQVVSHLRDTLTDARADLDLGLQEFGADLAVAADLGLAFGHQRRRRLGDQRALVPVDQEVLLLDADGERRLLYGHDRSLPPPALTTRPHGRALLQERGQALPLVRGTEAIDRGLLLHPHGRIGGRLQAGDHGGRERIQHMRPVEGDPRRLAALLVVDVGEFQRLRSFALCRS